MKIIIHENPDLNVLKTIWKVLKISKKKKKYLLTVTLPLKK